MKDRIMELLNLVSYNRYALENKRDDLTYLFPVITPMDGCPKRKLKPCYEFFREKMFPLIGSSSEADYSMEEITEMIGFTSADYFIRLFHRTYGVTPGKFRRMRQKGN